MNIKSNILFLLLITLIPNRNEAVCTEKFTKVDYISSVEASSKETLLSSEFIATTYNATPEQCNSNPFITASGYKIKKHNILGQRVLAMERTMMKHYKIKYGDKVRISGVSPTLDGVWIVRDTMNKRFAGKRKIDLLIPKHMKGGKWKNVKIYKIH